MGVIGYMKSLSSKTYFHGKTEVDERTFKPFRAKDGPVALDGSCLHGTEHWLASCGAAAVQVLNPSSFEDTPVLAKAIRLVLPPFVGQVRRMAQGPLPL